MKQGQIVRAYNAITKLSKASLPFASAYCVFKVKQQLEPHFLFEREQEMKILDHLGGEVRDAGRIHFPTDEAAMSFTHEIDDLQNVDIDLDVVPPVIYVEDVADCQFTPADIANLEGFIRFEQRG